jgi:predicted TPR repeat methyltransferase
MASLPRARYRRAFEPGCSIGVLTGLLAGRVDELVAADIAARPVDDARKRLGTLSGVSIEVMSVPEDWPVGTFDLIVLSEVGYYLTERDLNTLLAKATGCLDPGGDLVAVHWRLETDYPLTGDRVHQILRRTPRLGTIAHLEEREFLLDVMRRDP